MIQSNNIDYSVFGGTRFNEESEKKPQQQKQDYSVFGGTPAEQEKEKLGPFQSALAGLLEGTVGLGNILKDQVKQGKEYIGKKVFGDEYTSEPGSQVKEASKLVDEQIFGKQIPGQEKPSLSTELQNLPESQDQFSRRLRVAGQALPISTTGGIPGIIAGLVGSQAGQTVREVFGKEGKFDEFGFGEGAAIGIDLITGGLAGLTTSAIKSGSRTAINEVPAIFRNNQTGLERKVVKFALQNEERALQNVIDNFGQKQLVSFEEEAARLSPNRFTEMTQSNASGLKQQADSMFRNNQLDIISPIAATTEQGGRAIQEAANTIFQKEVVLGERAAYNAARESAEGLSGQAPKTIQQAKKLKQDLTRNKPTPEQQSVVEFLDDLISDLETQSGKKSQATTRTANELVELVQKSNQAINYGAESRLQSHRLIPVIKTLREEVASILATKPEAARLYQEANLLHGRNAEVWGTKYMRNVRFTENPESIIGTTRKASNMRNLKQSVQDPTIQALAERMVVNQMTETGAAEANRVALNNLSPELSPVARGAAQELINVKDPLTSTGGRAAIRNSILKDAAQSVNTGLPPTRILKLMQTPKGYDMVREAMSGSSQSKELFKSFERLFVEDIMSSIVDQSGKIDFSKARNILKNPEMRQVVEKIGGKDLIKKFQQLESFANNFEKNINLYSKPETQGLFKSLFKGSTGTALLGGLLHMLHMPWPVIATLGIGKGAANVGRIGFQALEKQILSNPKAMHYLEQVSKAKTVQELAKQLPRLAKELEKKD